MFFIEKLVVNLKLEHCCHIPQDEIKIYFMFYINYLTI